MTAPAKRRLIILIVLGATILLATLVILPNPRTPKTPPKQKEQPVFLDLDPNASWPIFRGTRDLRGIAHTALADSLTLIWKFKTQGPIRSSAVIDDGLVFIGSADGYVYAIELRTGNQRWRFKTGAEVEAPPCVVDGLVFVGSVDGWLYALQAKDGLPKWKYQTEGKIHSSANYFYAKDGSGLRVLLGSYDGKLHCVDAATGKPLWTYQTDNYINGAAAFTDNMAVFGGCDGLIHLIRATDGSQRTPINTDSYIAGSASIRAGRAYVGNYDGALVCADIKRAEILWQYKDADVPIFSSPAVTKDLVVFGSRDNRVHCLSTKDGQEVWFFQTLGHVDSSPVICQDKVVVGSNDGRLYLLRLTDGELLWSYQIGQPIGSSPALASGAVIVGCDDGYLYAFGPEN